MNIETHEISFSFDQPDDVLKSILTLLQQVLNQHKAKGSKMPDYRNILLIDNDKERAPYLAHILARVGYRPLVMENALDAFTRFLRVPFVPFVIILSHDDSANRLFLQRLLQQIAQKYHWEIPLIRLLTQPAGLSLPQPAYRTPSQVSDTLANQPFPGAELPQAPNTNSLSPYASYARLPQFPGMPAPRASNTNPLSQAHASQSSQLPNTPLPLTPTTNPLSLQPPGMPFSQGPTTNPLPPTSPVKPSPSSPFTSQPSFRMPVSGDLSGKEVENEGSARDDLRPQEEEKKISLEGQSIGRFQILSPLGDSPLSSSYKQYGYVYKAYDRLRERHVAMKVVPTSSLPYHLMEKSLEETNPFQMEVDLLRTLDHPHILPLWISGKSYISGTPFIYKTMPYCPEGSLGQWLYEHGGSRVFSPREVVHIIAQLADALQYAHDHQVTYQNFKLSNLLVHNQAKDLLHLHLKLVDFAMPQDGTFLSRKPDALPYVAPERWHSQVFPASDQYGLAVLAYELLTGRHPFQGSTVHVMKKLHTNLQPQPPNAFNPAVSSALNNVVLRALAKRPEERFASVAVFVQTFQRYCN
ncbi:MAG TPA: protein kinase [Ktedonosporobacter sp.]|nr:protein kinase [Ktedonosporobacter sp.]